ncbi:MAG: YrzE family protein [Promethearchaeia archaeon]
MSKKKELRREAKEIGNFIKLTLKTLLLFVFILIALTLGWGIYRAVAVPSDIDHTFTQDNIDLEMGNFTNGEAYNLGYPFNYTNTYNATFSFTDDIVGNTPIGWDDISSASCSGVVASITDSHNRTLDLYDNNAAGQVVVYRDFSSSQQNGTIEFWIKTSPINTDGVWVQMENSGGTDAILTRFENGNYQYRNSAGTWVTIFVYAVSTWYHFRFDFECNGDGYMGLSADYFFFYVDGVQYGQYTFRNAVVDIDQFEFVSLGADSNYHFYVDAVGFTWDNYYSIGDNVIPLTIEDLDTLQPIYDEFNFEGVNDLYETYDDNPNGWTDIETGGGDSVNVRQLQIPSYKPTWERTVEIACANAGNIRGLEKDFDSDAEYIQWDISHNIYSQTGAGIYMDMTIHSKDETEIVVLRIDDDGILKYIDSGASEVSLDWFRKLQIYYNFSLTVDYDSDMCKLSIYNGTDYTFAFPLKATGKTGLGTIQYEIFGAVGVAMVSYVDSFSVYVDGDSLAEDYGYIAPQMDLTGIYDLNTHYLVNMTNLIGNFSIYACATDGVDYVPDYSDEQVVREREVYNNFSIWENICKNTNGFIVSDTIVNVSIVVFIDFPTSFSIGKINLFGGHLEIENEVIRFNFIYYPDIHQNDSYFWVDNNNYLNWYCELTNDTLESMNLFLDVPNFATVNRSIYFYGYQDYQGNRGTSFGMTYVGDEQDNFQISPDYRLYHYSLRPTTTLDYYFLSVGGALDLFNVSGYITSISFNYLPSYTDLTITTLSLFNVIIPLIIVLVPSIGFGSKFGKNGFLLMFFFMSLICAITGLIPAWIMFIIVVAYILFLFNEKRRGVIGGI